MKQEMAAQLHIARDERTGKWHLSAGLGNRVRHIDLGAQHATVDAAEAMAATRLPFDPEWERTSLTYSDVTNVPEDFTLDQLMVFG